MHLCITGWQVGCLQPQITEKLISNGLSIGNLLSYVAWNLLVQCPQVLLFNQEPLSFYFFCSTKLSVLEALLPGFLQQQEFCVPCSDIAKSHRRRKTISSSKFILNNTDFFLKVPEDIFSHLIGQNWIKWPWTNHWKEEYNCHNWTSDKFRYTPWAGNSYLPIRWEQIRVCKQRRK